METLLCSDCVAMLKSERNKSELEMRRTFKIGSAIPYIAMFVMKSGIVIFIFIAIFLYTCNLTVLQSDKISWDVDHYKNVDNKKDDSTEKTFDHLKNIRYVKHLICQSKCCGKNYFSICL